jgi:hypothetical protein
MTNDQRDLMVRYLLGGALPEEEQQDIEQRYFDDEDFFEEMELVEQELIDNYLNGRLTQEDQKSFEKHYLAVHWRRRRVELIRALDTALRDSRSGNATLVARLQERIRRVLAAAGRVAEECLSNAGIPSLVLNAVERSAEKPGSVVTLVSTTRIVRIVAEIGTALEYEAWTIAVESAGREIVWLQEDPFIRFDDQIATAEIYLPAEHLPVGDYFVVLRGRNADSSLETVATFQFAVEAASPGR